LTARASSLNGGSYSGFQIATSSITFAIQNLTLTHFTTANNEVSGGVIGFQPNLTGANLRLYNVDMSNNIDNGWGNALSICSTWEPGHLTSISISQFSRQYSVRRRQR
jgi:hypothetical protein